jgi:hypothetical protein
VSDQQYEDALIFRSCAQSCYVPEGEAGDEWLAGLSGRLVEEITAELEAR